MNKINHNNCNICNCDLNSENKVNGKIRCITCNKKINIEYKIEYNKKKQEGEEEKIELYIRCYRFKPSPEKYYKLWVYELIDKKTTPEYREKLFKIMKPRPVK